MHEFRTTDVDLAAYLECRGFTVVRVDPPPAPPPWLAEFVFYDSHALDLAVIGWQQPGEHRFVDALDFARHRIRLYRWARSTLDAIRPAHRERGRG